MTLRKVARWHPFLWLGGLTFVIMLLGPFIPLHYDDRGLGTAWFVFTYALTFVFRKTSQLAYWLTGQETGFLHGLLAVAGGVAAYLVADWGFSKLARRVSPPESVDGPHQT